MKGLDKQIEKNIEKIIFDIDGWNLSPRYVADEIKKLTAQAVQEALAKQKEELVESIEEGLGHSFNTDQIWISKKGVISLIRGEDE